MTATRRSRSYEVSPRGQTRRFPVAAVNTNAAGFPRGAIIFARRSRKPGAPAHSARLRRPHRLALAGGTYARDVYAARVSLWRSGFPANAAIFPTPVRLFPRFTF